YWYNGAEAPNETLPLLWVNGTGATSATTPTAYAIGFVGGSNTALNPLSVQSQALTGGLSPADTSAPTEFYNPNIFDSVTGETGADYLYFGLTNQCGTGYPNGCLVQIDLGHLGSAFGIVNGYEVVGGTTGIIIDNDGTGGQESNLYFGTKLGQTQNVGVSITQPSLVKLTQNNLE
ncbi:MAG TPA: hypothetical protein VML19_35960, partial [Verrucomicrobiae bacterium]|nr:hypothetical protein [Verrucomicrobiae bacterium]